MDVCVFDLASLRYRWSGEDHRALAVLSARGEVLGYAEGVGALSLREAAFRACEAALARGRVSRAVEGTGLRRCKVAFYNPYTAQIALGPAETGTVLEVGARLEVPTGGLVLERRGDTLVVGDDELRVAAEGYARARDQISSHLGL